LKVIEIEGMDFGHLFNHDGSEPAIKNTQQQSKEEIRTTICYSSKPGSIKADDGILQFIQKLQSIAHLSKI